MQIVDSISRGAYQLSDPDHMHTSLLLGIWILHQDDLRICLEALDLGQLDEIIYAFPVELQVEAGVLERARQLDNRLTDILDLLLAGNLKAGKAVRRSCFHKCHSLQTHHHLDLIRLMRKLHGDLEETCVEEMY